MKYLIAIAFIFFSISVIGQNKAILIRDNLGVTIQKKDSIVSFDEFFTDSTAWQILRQYDFVGSGKTFWFNGVKITLQKYAFFFTRKRNYR